jgi:hypothetical protein
MQPSGDANGELIGDGDDNEEDDDIVPIPQRYLRLRDYNPYSVMQTLEEENAVKENGKRKGGWGTPRVVVEPSKTDVKGVFKEDITSWLPYVEVVSEQTFEVTDVMMDDCRLLLLRVRPPPLFSLGVLTIFCQPSGVLVDDYDVWMF